jgi:hypothetical protein
VAYSLQWSEPTRSAEVLPNRILSPLAVVDSHLANPGLEAWPGTYDVSFTFNKALLLQAGEQTANRETPETFLEL